MESVYNMWSSFNKVVSQINEKTTNKEKQRIWLKGKLEVASEFSVNSANYKNFIEEFSNNEMFDKISISTGQGRLANTPWISFLNNEISTDRTKDNKPKTSNGFYPVILFDRDGIYIAAAFAIEGLWNKYDEIIEEKKMPKKDFHINTKNKIRKSLSSVILQNEKMVSSFWYHDFPQLIKAPREYLDAVWTGIYIKGSDITDEYVKIVLKEITDNLILCIEKKLIPNNCESFNNHILDINQISDVKMLYDVKHQIINYKENMLTGEYCEQFFNKSIKNKNFTNNMNDLIPHNIDWTKTKWMNENEEMCKPYDFILFTNKGKEIFLDVKGTKQKKYSFIVSDNEYNYMNENKNDYFIINFKDVDLKKEKNELKYKIFDSNIAKSLIRKERTEISWNYSE